MRSIYTACVFVLILMLMRMHAYNTLSHGFQRNSFIGRYAGASRGNCV